MINGIKCLTGCSFILFSALCAAQQTSVGSVAVSTSHHDTLTNYCITCHNDTLITAGLSLQNADVENVGKDGAIWEKVLRKLKARTMPPGGMPRPNEATYDAFATYLQSRLDQHSSEHPHPGEPILRRLNRTEYKNSVRDLLAVDIEADTLLPADNAMSGFDNIGAMLTISPLLTERYISAARKVRREAIADPGMHPDFEYYTVSKILMQDDRMSEDLPFGSRGGIAIEHNFPMDGDYVVQVRLQQNYREYIRGLINKPHHLDIRLDGERIQLFTIGGEKLGKSSVPYSTAAQGDIEQEQYERYADKALEVRFPAKAGKRLITAAFLKETTLPEEPLYSPLTLYDYTQYKGGEPGIRTVAIGGPFDAKGTGTTASREKIFICGPADNSDDVNCARNILSSISRLAFRGQQNEEQLEELLRFYKQGQKEGGFDAGIGMAIERILAGPEFLFLVEETPENVSPGDIYQISDLELATRLSLFLWSSIPDSELLDLAESGKLNEPEVLEQQVRRLLYDPRSQALVDNFAAQWLNLGKLNVAAPDLAIFPYFDDNLREAFRQETKLFFEYVLRNDRPLLELLDANYTFLNERLARHYQIPDIYGSHFRKVALTPGQPRGGLLSQGSILTVTSYANRTAPTIRGKWVLENILSAPPPPPPANVPGLRDKNDQGKVLNMRQRMEQHRANPVCASCHKVMDPLGFAMENFDATGRWRTMDTAANTSIDASGELPDGTRFEGIEGLREVLLEKRSDDFVLTVVEKLLTYALGRELHHTDAPIMRSIVKDASHEDYRLSSLIVAIVKSIPFQMRRVPSHDDI